MTYYDPFQDPVGARILKAFSGPTDLWRTPGGVARETGLPTEKVESYIKEHPDVFIPSTLTVSGSVLYTIREDLKERARSFTDVS